MEEMERMDMKRSGEVREREKGYSECYRRKRRSRMERFSELCI